MSTLEIYVEGCKGCGYCVGACPRGVLVMGDEINARGHLYVVAENIDNCNGCGLCYKMCPDVCITVDSL